MSFEKLSYLAQMVASVGVIVSLIFVGLQIRQNTGALQRNEHNSTMAQWTVIRMAIAKHRDIAELMTAGLHGERALDAGDDDVARRRIALRVLPDEQLPVLLQRHPRLGSRSRTIDRSPSSQAYGRPGRACAGRRRIRLKASTSSSGS